MGIRCWHKRKFKNDLKQEGSIIALRFEGLKNSTDKRIENLFSELKTVDLNISILQTLQSEIFWNKVRSLEFFSFTQNSILRIVIPPSECI